VLPVYVDSPLAIEVTEVYCRHPGEHRFELTALADRDRCPLRTCRLQLARTPEESKALNHARGPLVIIAGSGMATGGRILHHLARRLPDAATTVLLVGFQAEGTRGRALQDGATTLRLHGHDVPVRASVESVQGLSAHADRDEILRWLSGFKKPPRQTYVVHGEPGPAAALAETILGTLHWKARPAVDGETVELLRHDDAGALTVTAGSASSP
jgi:metallo-beta-lactamase family protein